MGGGACQWNHSASGRCTGPRQRGSGDIANRRLLPAVLAPPGGSSRAGRFLGGLFIRCSRRDTCRQSFGLAGVFPIELMDFLHTEDYSNVIGPIPPSAASKYSSSPSETHSWRKLI